MHMKYRRGERFGLPHKKQSLIYFLCVNYRDLPQEVLHKINNLCYRCGGELHQALFQAVTSEELNLKVAMDHYISESTLSRKVRDFYRSW